MKLLFHWWRCLEFEDHYKTCSAGEDDVRKSCEADSTKCAISFSRIWYCLALGDKELGRGLAALTLITNTLLEREVVTLIICKKIYKNSNWIHLQQPVTLLKRTTRSKFGSTIQSDSLAPKSALHNGKL